MGLYPRVLHINNIPEITCWERELTTFSRNLSSRRQESLFYTFLTRNNGNMRSLGRNPGGLKRRERGERKEYPLYSPRMREEQE